MGAVMGGECQDLPPAFCSLRIRLPVLVHLREVPPKGSILRIDFDGTPEGGDRLVKFSLLPEKQTEVGMGLRQRRLQAQSFGVGRVGFREPAGAAPDIAEHQVNGGVVWLQAGSFAALCGRLVVTPDAEQGLSEIEVSFGRTGLSLDFFLKPR